MAASLLANASPIRSIRSTLGTVCHHRSKTTPLETLRQAPTPESAPKTLTPLLRIGSAQDASVKQAIDGLEYTVLSIADEANWDLFETLGLSGTPAFVVVDGERSVKARLQGVQNVESFLWFLQQ